MMAAGERSKPPATGDRLKTIREWVDVLAKAAIAIAGVSLAYLADNYQQKTSVVTLLSQRETAESNLRSSMMDHLIGPFIGSAVQNKPLDPDRARVLLELLALNFHTHFELKPLFLRVDDELQQEGNNAGRRALQQVARRVIDRQIAMLRAAMPQEQRSIWARLFSRAPVGAKQADLFFERTERLEDPSKMLFEADEAASSSDLADTRVNIASNPARFAVGGGQSVCSASPDHEYALRVRVTSYDRVSRTAGVSWQVTADREVCQFPPGGASQAGTDKGESVWQPAKTFNLSPYDFPLTDNAQVDPTRRFAMSLYYIDDDDPQYVMLQLKLVWFPEGYITERERPMNYFEVNKTLGIE